MKLALHQPEFLIRFYYGRRGNDLGKVATWDGSSLMSLGHPARYLIQRKGDRVLIRNLVESDEVKIAIRTFDLKAALESGRIPLNDKNHDAIEIVRLYRAPAISPAAVQRVPKVVLQDKGSEPEDRYFMKMMERFGIFSLVMALAIFFFQPAEPELSTNEELIPKKYAKLIMVKPKEKMSAPAAGGSNPSQAQTKAVARAFQSKNVQKSIQSILKGGISKYSIMTTGKAITSLSQKAVSSSNAPGVGLQNKADGLLAGSRVGAVQIGSDSGYGSGNGVNVKGQGRGQTEIGLNTADATVDEGLTKEEVAKVIHAHMNEIRFCYESAILRDPTLAGKVLIDFKIGGNGVVASAGITETSVSDRAVGNCLSSKLRTWKFPNPRGGVTVAVSYPFIFKSLSR